MKRPADELMALIDTRRQEPRWIVEGVYGELVQPFLSRAEGLVWLDVAWEVSRARLERRRLQRREAASDDHAFQMFLAYAEAYWKRDDGRSHAGHLRLVEEFGGAKYHLTSEDEVDSFLASTARQGE
jgi:hypothetical protein